MAALANRPISRVPITPPTRCTPTTSSESSYPNLDLSPPASGQIAPAINPTNIAPIGVTAPQAGVMATSPATAPDAAPTPVTCPSLTFSTASHASVAAQVAVNVVTITIAADVPAANADPPLKAYQPAQSRPAPSSVSGTLCGLRSLPQPADLPSTIATASAAAPALMCTAVPPAKSMACSLLAIQPPTAFSVTTPSKAKTQCATGKYTRTAQAAAKTIHAPNFIRSAAAPEISATVIAANSAWNNANNVTGRPLMVVCASSRFFMPANSVKLPTRPPVEVPNVMENPNSTHSTPTRAAAPNVIIIMLVELLTETMPP